jgi:hypothetical protein
MTSGLAADPGSPGFMYSIFVRTRKVEEEEEEETKETIRDKFMQHETLDS